MKLEALCDSTLERLGVVSQDMCMEEYTLLDLLLGVRVPSCDGQTNTNDCNRHVGILEKGTGCFRSSTRRCPSRTRHKVTALEGSRRKGPFGFCSEASGRRNSNSCHPRKNGGCGPYRWIAAPESGASWGEVAAWVVVGKKCGAYEGLPHLLRLTYCGGELEWESATSPNYGCDNFKLVPSSAAHPLREGRRNNTQRT